MNGFIQHLITRHIAPAANVMPRVRSLFEPETASGMLQANSSFEQDTAHEPAPPTWQEKTYPIIPSITDPVENRLVPSRPIEEESFPGNPTQAMPPSAIRSSGRIERGMHKEDLPLLPDAEDIQPALSLPRRPLPPNMPANKTAVNLSGQEEKWTDASSPDTGRTDLAEGRSRKNKEGAYFQDTPSPNAPVKPVLPHPASQTNREWPLLQGFRQTASQQLPSSQPPAIKVTIGRIDVRAVIQQPAQPTQRKPAAKPALSLEEYLKQRNNRTL
ncbi:MAG: hypothetical protein INR73_01935 [Williamsia sp.]|nr:hypothetical protein [Williamsia sp.]